MNKIFNKTIIIYILALIFIMSGCSSENSNETIEGVKDYYNLKINQNDYNFLQDIQNENGNVSVDSSRVDFSKAGKYEIFFNLKNSTVSVKSFVRIYDTPKFISGESDISKEEFIINPLKHICAFDSMGEPLPVQLITDLQTLQDGANEVEYQTIDCVGNSAKYIFKVNLFSNEDLYGRTISGQQGVHLWEIATLEQENYGNSISWDDKEGAYKLESYCEEGSFMFGGNNANFLTLGSRWYDAIEFEWKSNDVDLTIAQQGIGYKIKSDRNINTYQKSILPLAMYDARFWDLSFVFSCKDNGEKSVIYVKNLRMVNTIDYFDSINFDSPEYLSLWYNSRIKTGKNKVEWDDKEDAIKLTNSYLNENGEQTLDDAGFSFGGLFGLLDVAWGTDSEKGNYDAIVLQYKQSSKEPINIAFQGYPITYPQNNKKEGDWQTVIAPLNYKNILNLKFLGREHCFAGLTLRSVCQNNIPTIIWVKNIKIVRLSEYTDNLVDWNW